MRGMKIATGVVVMMLAALQSCAAIAPRPVIPRVQVEGVRTASLVDNDVTLLIALRVSNPNAFAVSIDSADAVVRIEGIGAANGRLPAPVTLAANADTRVNVEARTTTDALAKVVEVALRRGRVAYAISGVAIIQDGRRVTYSKHGELAPADLVGARR